MPYDPTTALTLFGVVGVLGLLCWIFWQAEKAGAAKEKAKQEHEALDNIMAGIAIEDKYRADEATRKKVDNRFNKGANDGHTNI